MHYVPIGTVVYFFSNHHKWWNRGIGAHWDGVADLKRSMDARRKGKGGMIQPGMS